MRTRRNILAMAAGLVPAPFVGFNKLAAAADPWPTKPIRIVVSFPPGGSIDTLARILLAGLSSKLGTNVFVENKPGAIGTIGNQLVARSAPDGYTFLVTVVASYTTTVKVIKVQYDALRDLPPVAIFAGGGQVFVTGPKFKFRSLNDVFEFARARPGVVNYGIIGKATQDHIAGEFLRREQNLQWQYIPFGGTASIFQALMAGDIHLTCSSFPVMLPHVQEGSVIGLAVAGKEPLPSLPGLPAAGLPRYIADYTYAVASPRGVPEPIIERFHNALYATLAEPATLNKLREHSLSPLFYSPAESARTIRDETEALAPLLAGMGLGM
jgi:tripartite-type tricarboxylate transporter receptor subunit TctC